VPIGYTAARRPVAPKLQLAQPSDDPDAAQSSLGHTDRLAGSMKVMDVNR